MDYSKSCNGRINLCTKPKTTYTEPDIEKLFSMYDKIPVNQCATYRDPVLVQFEETLLSRAYFSEENIKIIQNGIRAGVYRKSNMQYLIGPQDYDSLKIIMRSIYLQHSINQSTDIPKQIEELNNMVLEYCIPKIYLEAQGYLKYLSDVSSIPEPMPMPIMTAQNDKRNIKLKNWF
jgi:hypothetical protein